MCTLRATSSHITAALTASRAVLPIVKTPWFLSSTALRAVVAKRLDHGRADVLATDQGERGDRDLAAELVGHHREHTRDRLAATGPRRGVRRVGVHDAADVGQVPVDVRRSAVSDDGR